MKKMLILLAALAVLAVPAFGQAPPSTVVAGIHIQDGEVNFTMQGGGNINVIQKKNQYGHVTGQAYLWLGGFYADDAFVDEEVTKTLDAFAGYAIAERWVGSGLSVATGIGVLLDVVEGEDETQLPLLAKVGYKPFEWLDLGVTFQYIPIGNEVPDVMLVGTNLSITP